MASSTSKDSAPISGVKNQRYGLLLTGNLYEMDLIVDPLWRVPLSKL
jgi:hypothetical protein